MARSVLIRVVHVHDVTQIELLDNERIVSVEKFVTPDGWDGRLTVYIEVTLLS